jgi:Fic family protein
MNKLNQRQKTILSLFSPEILLTPKDISNSLNIEASIVTISRDLSELVKFGLLKRTGTGPSTKYTINTKALLLLPVNINDYFKVNTDDRKIVNKFNLNIFDDLKNIELFDKQTTLDLENLQATFKSNYKQLSPTIIKKEIERVTIELSWKSSAIEGNTYTLLDTENLLKEGILAKGKQKSEAIMLLNHKHAIDYIFKYSDEFKQISLSKIEHLHQLMTENLEIRPNIRKTIVGITGTKYQPLDNQFQIKESLEKLCILINSTKNIFTKSLLSILLISYIQPFEDGNKRTGRILGNAILLANNYFPLPLRNVNENVYRESTLLFYEQNNLSEFIKMYVDQCHFSVENYFRA